MSQDVPPLNMLAAFESAARHHSFSRAAAELHITDSAISHRIRLLEEHVGEKLFLRTRGGLTLTGKGTHYLSAVQNALATLKTASARVPFDISIPAVSSYFALYLREASRRPEITALLDWLRLVARSTR